MLTVCFGKRNPILVTIVVVKNGFKKMGSDEKEKNIVGLVFSKETTGSEKKIK